jgi:hypothetical protein
MASQVLADRHPVNFCCVQIYSLLAMEWRIDFLTDRLAENKVSADLERSKVFVAAIKINPIEKE